MRIGNHIIDTDWMTEEDLTTVICELRRIRERKRKQEQLVNRMNELLADAVAARFVFCDDCGRVLEAADLNLVDTE